MYIYFQYKGKHWKKFFKTFLSAFYDQIVGKWTGYKVKILLTFMTVSLAEFKQKKKTRIKKTVCVTLTGLILNTKSSVHAAAHLCFRSWKVDTGD